MIYHFSRRAFIKATSSLLIGATAIGNAPFINPLQIAHAQATPATWMASMSDDTLLSRLTIPGTHESCALGPGGPWAQCQKWSLQQQLTSGIRFLDIRCKQDDDNKDRNVLKIYHGIVDQNMTFSDVLDACTSFLQANPTECIVMSVKEESTHPSSTFADTFNLYVLRSRLKNFQYPNLWYIYDDVPVLGQVRGKIVVFTRFGGTGLGPVDWQDNATFPGEWGGEVYYVQDQYKVPTILAKDINHKRAAIHNLLMQAAADTTNAWYINFTSGASSGAYPNAVADRIHPWLYDTELGTYLSDVIAGNTFPNRLGTLMLDFPDPYEVNRIITLNWISGFPNP